MKKIVWFSMIVILAGCSTPQPPKVSQGAGIGAARTGIVTTIEANGKRSVDVKLQ